MNKSEAAKAMGKLKSAWRKAKGNPDDFAELLSTDGWNGLRFEYEGRYALRYDSYGAVYYFSGSGMNPFDMKIVVKAGEISEALISDDLELEEFNSYEEWAKEASSGNLDAKPALYLSLTDGMIRDHLADWPFEMIPSPDAGRCILLDACARGFFLNKGPGKARFEHGFGSFSVVYEFSAKKLEKIPEERKA